MNPIRITMIAPFGIRPKGTLIARMLPLAKAMVRAGLQCMIVAPPVHNPQDAGTTVVVDGVTITHTAVPRLPGVLGVLEQTWLLLVAVRSSGPELVYLFKPKGHAGLAAQWYRWWTPQTALVVDCDDREGTGGWNDVLPYPQPARWLFDWQERTLPRQADAVTVASRTLQTLCWADGCAAPGVFYVPNAADVADAVTTQPLPGTPATPRVVLYTRFWEFDRAAVVQLLVDVCNAHTGVVFDVIGTGENGEERDFAARCAAAGIAERVRLHGWVQPAAIPVILAGAVLAIVPVHDTLINRARCSAKLLELLAAGLAVVGQDVGETRTFVVDGQNGLLVAADDTAAFAAAVVGLLNDPERLQRYQRGARQSALLHRWDSRVAACLGAVAHAMASASSRGRR